MFKHAQWVAVVRDGRWLVAKVIQHKKSMEIEYLREFVQTRSSTNGTISEDAGQVEETEPQLKEWLSQEKIPLRKLKIAFSSRGLITRVIVLPEISKKDLEQLMSEQVEQYFTLNIQDYLVDYRVLEHFSEDGQLRQRVLLAAVPKPVWEPFLQTCQTMGWQPKTVDLAVDCLVRIYTMAASMSLGGSRSLKAGRRRQHSFIRSSQQVVQKLRAKMPLSFQKNLSYPQSAVLKPSDGWTKRFGLSPSQKGLNQRLADIVIVALNLGRVEIVILENGVFFLYSDLEFSWQGSDRADVLLPVLEEALVPVFRVLAEFINFFAARHFGKAIDELYLTGEYADVPVMIDLFTENLGIPTSVGFPTGWQPSFTKKAKEQGQNWMKYADLYGLALRED